MFRKVNLEDSEQLVPVPDELPPLEGLDDADSFRDEFADEFAPDQRPRVWLWTLIAAMAVMCLLGYVLVLGAMGFYDGLKDRAVESARFAQEHYAEGVERLRNGEYELAIAEFELALRHDSNLPNARAYLREAKDMAQTQVMPTSETRIDAATLLYRQAVAHYESGNLPQVIVVLDELKGLDAVYQKQNVTTMLTTAHLQLGYNAVNEDQLDDARDHFEAVLGLKPNDAESQGQLDLIRLYTAALNYWDRDWSATIQSLKGLYALAPEYKDVRSRLHDAYVHLAQNHTEAGDWCQAASEYAAAVEVSPLETTVGMRDDAAIRCQTLAQAPSPTPTSAATTTPAAKPTTVPTKEPVGPTPAPGDTPPPEATETAEAASVPVGEGKIVFTSYDAARQRYDIYAVNLAQGAAQLLREHASQPAMATGGKRLAFRNLDPMHLGLGVLDLRSNELGELTVHTEDVMPAWSPNAQQIVFASNKHGDRKWRVYAISPGAVRGEGEEWAYGQTPTWSPDGSQVAYHGCDERGDNCGVWVMKAGGFDPNRLTTNASDSAPAWSADGSRVAFISTRAGNWEIHMVDVASGKETRLTEHPAADVAPTWSPNGQRLAFLSNREGAWAVYVLEVNSGKIQKIIATGDAYPDPVSERLSWVP